MSMEIKIELGHKAWKNIKPNEEGYTHDWRLFVQGYNGNGIEHIVEKVIFYLPDSYPDPKRIRDKPPFVLSESTSWSLSIQIDVFFCTEAKLNKVNYIYNLFITNEVVTNSWVRKLTFPKPSKEFKEKLLLSGGELVDLQKTFHVVIGALLKCKAEPDDGIQILNNAVDDAINTTVKKADNFQNECNTSNKELFHFRELLKKNETLKSANREIKQNISRQEKLMAFYEEHFSHCEANILNTKMDINQLKKKTEAEEREISALKLQLQMLQNKLLEIENLLRESSDEKMRGMKGKNRGDLDVSHEYLLLKRNISAAVGKRKENVTQPTEFISTRDDSTTSLLKNAFVPTKNQHICKTVKLESMASVVLNSSQSKTDIALNGLCNTLSRNCFLPQTKKETQSLNDTSAHLQNVCNNQNLETLNCDRNVSSAINFSFKSTNICNIEKFKEANSANASLNKPDLSYNNVNKPIHGSSVETNSSLNSPEIIIGGDEKSAKGSSVQTNFSLNKLDIRNSDVEKIVEGKSLEALSSVSIPYTKPCNMDKTQEQYVSSIKITNIKSPNSNCIENVQKLPKERKKEESQKGDLQSETLLINSISKKSHQDLDDTSAPKFTSFLTEHCQKLVTELGRRKNSEFSKYREGTNSLFYKLENIDTDQINEECFIQYVYSLIDYFSDPKTLDMPTLIYLVVDYLYRDRIQHESLPTYIQNQDTCVFLPPSENCIVSALFEVDKKSLPHLNGLVRNTLNIIHQVIISKKKMTVDGLASLCRVFMEICRRNNDRWEPLFLCCELLKLGHPLALYLINSLAAVWRDPFSIYDRFSVEEKILLGSIIYGMKEKPLLMDSGLWMLTHKLRSTYFPHPLIIDCHQATQFLTAEIVSRCIEGLFENLWMLASPLIIFVSKETLEWKLHFRNGYILPNLMHFSRCLNEQGFGLFCNLYVDIFSACHESPYEELLQYFANTAFNHGVKFVQDCAAVALLKYIGTTDKHIPAPLRDWFLRNQDNPKLAVLIDLYCKKIMESRDSFLLWDDIIIV